MMSYAREVRFYRLFLGVWAGLALISIAPAQQPRTAEAASVPLPVFDVVSIKQHDPGDTRGMMKATPDGIRLVNILLGDIIREAYGLHFNGQIKNAPSWVYSMRFDVEARVAEGDLTAFQRLTPIQHRAMVQPVLADRFGLKVHHEDKVLPVYALTVAKSGLKMKEATPGDTYAHGIRSGDGVIRPNSMAVSRDATGENQIRAQGVAITRLVEALSEGEQDRMIVDRSGLTGKYDFTLTWTPGQDSPEGRTQDAASAAPSLFTALEEQLGLKLEATKTLVDTIVIDHVAEPSND